LLDRERNKEDKPNKAMLEDDEAPSMTQIHLTLTPDHLKQDANFQEHYAACKLKLQNMVLWWQRTQSMHPDITDEKLGKIVRMSEQMIKLLEDCSQRKGRGGNKSPNERPKLHNQHY